MVATKSWWLAAAISTAAANGVAAQDTSTLQEEPDSSAPEEARREQARTHFERGVELYEDRDYSSALIEFRRARSILPNWRVGYNLGIALLNLHRYAEARRALTSYLDEGGDRIESERRAVVEREVERLEARISSVMVTTNVDGANVLVDGEPVGRTPLDEPLVVSAGRRELRVSALGHTDEVRSVDVVGGVPLQLQFVLELLPREVSPWAATGSSLAWTMGAISVITGGVAIATGLLTIDANDRLDSLLLGTPDPSEVDATRDEVRTFALTTDALAGASALTGLLAVIFAVSAGAADGEEDDDPVAPDLVPDVTIGLGAIGLQGEL